MKKLNLKNDIVVNGKKYLLSTVSVAAQHFETMLFEYYAWGEVDFGGVYELQTCTAEQAASAHSDILELLQNGI